MKGQKRWDENKRRSSFVWHPSAETAQKMEEIISRCGITANMAITQLVEYALGHMTLGVSTIQVMKFEGETNE